MNEKDKNEFLNDFKKADISNKLDMWFFALDQEVIWDEIISEFSTIAQMKIGAPSKTTDK